MMASSDMDLALHLFDELVLQQPDAATLCADNALPADAAPLVQAHVALALHGARAGLASWLPRPRLQDGDEAASLAVTLQALVEARVTEALAEVTAARDHAHQRARHDLADWNRQREVVRHQDLPSPQTVEALRDVREPLVTGEVETLPDGKYRWRYQFRKRPERST